MNTFLLDTDKEGHKYFIYKKLFLCKICRFLDVFRNWTKTILPIEIWFFFTSTMLQARILSIVWRKLRFLKILMSSFKKWLFSKISCFLKYSFEIDLYDFFLEVSFLSFKPRSFREDINFWNLSKKIDFSCCYHIHEISLTFGKNGVFWNDSVIISWIW